MRCKAFTLVELMIVVAILGILAAIVIPQLQGNTIKARESAAKDTLRTWRSQIEFYKMQHNGKAPGYKGPLAATAAELKCQFIGTSDINGNAVTAVNPAAPYLYGPYLKAIPKNPFNNSDKITTNGTLGDNGGGWEFDTSTGAFHADDNKEHSEL